MVTLVAIRSSGGRGPPVAAIFDFVQSFSALLKVEILLFQFKFFWILKLDDITWQRFIDYRAARYVIENVAASHYAVGFYISLATMATFREELRRCMARRPHWRHTSTTCSHMTSSWTNHATCSIMVVFNVCIYSGKCCFCDLYSHAVL